MIPNDIIDLSNAQILIVDDDAVTRLLFRRILTGEGFEVREASSGAEAIKQVDELVPDLVLLDVSMGSGMNGFETCVALKKIDAMSDVPVIFVTGHADPESHVEGFESGGRDYIVKPIQRTEAVARICNHLEVRMLLKQQKHYIESLRRSDAAKNRLISVASHDLRNPLASIMGYAEMLSESGPLTIEQATMVDTIHATSESMLQLVEKLLARSITDDDTPVIEREKSCINEILQSSVNIYRFLAEKKDIELHLKLAEKMYFDLYVDRTQFRRLIDNLVSNAIKFSEPHSKVLISVRAEAEHMKIVVEDEGQGIPDGEIGRLFKDFGTTSAKPTANESSTGLGLSICREIVEGHDGTICAENREDGKGARFTVELSEAKLRA